MPITAAGHAAWALGVARSMLDDVRELAQSRIRMGDMSTLAHKPTFQRGLVAPRGHVARGAAADHGNVRAAWRRPSPRAQS